ncbi:MAG: protein kinase [Gammaproteobacteria bacterium]|nr:protein kinase [Gammaproteobacteria bacterium]
MSRRFDLSRDADSFKQARELFEQCIDLDADGIERILADAPSRVATQVRILLAADADAAPTESLRPQVPDDMPSHIGPYRVLEHIATGGMGEVYIAEQLQPLRRRVAIKIIRAGMDTAEVLARFESERQALAMMNHPNIARIIDAGKSENLRPYFVMEYVPGVPITDYCDEHKLDINQRLELFIEICNAVQHAHHKGIIHRDIKPSNILVMEQDGRPSVKVIDFGIAKAVNQQLTERTLHTRLGHIIGTPEYMSPEQAELSPLEIDTRTDVYSLGVIFYELLSGRVPFRFARSASLLTLRDTLKTEAVPVPGQWLTREPVEAEQVAMARDATVPELLRTLRGELESIAYMALAKSPQSRYPTAAALAEDVRRYLDGDTVQASRSQRFYQTRKLLWRHRFGLAVTLAAFAMVSAFAGMMAYQASEIRVERDRANQEAATSRQVAGFLEDVFKAAGPFEAQGRRLTAIELIDEGVTKLPERMPEPSLARLRLARILGEVYTDLGRFEKAEAMLAMALADSRQLLGDTHHETLVALSEYSRNRWALGDLEGAESGYREVLAAYRGVPGMEKSEARTLANLGGLQMARRHYASALSTLQEAQAKMRSTFGADHINVALIGGNIATALDSLGRNEESVAIFEEILPRIERELGMLHPHTLGMKSNLGTELVDLGDYDAAIPLLQEVLAVQREVIGEDHPDTLFTEGSLAFGRAKAGELEEGRRQLQDVIARLRRTRGEGSRDAFRMRIGLAQLMVKDSDAPDSAIAALRDIENEAAAALGDANEISASAVYHQARLATGYLDDVEVINLLRRYLDYSGEPQLVMSDSSLRELAAEIPEYADIP